MSNNEELLERLRLDAYPPGVAPATALQAANALEQADRELAKQAAIIEAVKAILDEPLDPRQVLDNHPGRALWGATLASRARRILTSTYTS